MVTLRLALRDLRGGLSGLRLLAVCLFLAVFSLAGVGSLATAVLSGLSDQGQEILGGDVQAEMNQRLASPDELAAFDREGTVSRLVRMRAMATPESNGAPTLVELKGIDQLYPFYGSFTLSSGALAVRPHGLEVAVAPELAERTGLRLGASLRIGNASFRVIGFIDNEPDRVSQGFALGPSVMMDDAGLTATGLVQPGSLFIAAYRMKIPAGVDPAVVTQRLQHAFPAAGLKVEDRLNAAPGTRRFLERLGQFLTLVALTALMVAGIGIGNGVASYLDGRRGAIATLRMLGATAAVIFRIYLIQISLVALLATALGLAAGSVLPSIVLWAVGSLIPSPASEGVYAAPLLLAALYGLLAALAFALPPLARARTVPAATLLRGDLEPVRGTPWWARGLALAAGAAIAALAIWTAPAAGLALGFVGAMLALLLFLALLGLLIRKLLSLLPRPRNPLLRLALANLHRPGAATVRLVVALGLGLTLFATMGIIESSLSFRIREAIPAGAPSFFVLDVPAARAEAFRGFVTEVAPGGEASLTPSLRGAVTAIHGRRIVDMPALPEGAWFLRGDRGITYAAEPPPGTRVVEGEWWPPDYRGPPLVSLDADNARAAGLGIGDSITVSVMGREIIARIANLREVDFSRVGLNFVIVFAPGALESAPHSFVGLVALPLGQEEAFARAVNRGFPSVIAVRIDAVMATISTLMDELAGAVRAAGGVAILAGLAVLIGALAATRRARTYDAVLLKLLGATRARILAVQALEFTLLALILGLLALGLGTAAGWYVVTEVLRLDWAPDWPGVLLTVGGGAALTLVIGLIGSWSALAARPARALRAL
jgi:putative ABC transport system permease protein